MKPTIGRIVHFHTKASDRAHAALVVDDEHELGLMLQVFGHNGSRFHATVPAEENLESGSGYSWNWPPRD